VSDVDGAKGLDVPEAGTEVATRSILTRVLPVLLIVVCLAATTAAVFSFSKSFEPPGGVSAAPTAGGCAMDSPEGCASGMAAGGCASGMAALSDSAAPVGLPASPEDLTDCIEACVGDEELEDCIEACAGNEELADCIEACVGDEELEDCIEACTKDLGDPEDSDQDPGAEDVDVGV